MKIVYQQIKDLKEYENNPRFNDEAVDAVAASIKEFGFKVPIIVDKDNVIIAGHTRLKAAKKLLMGEVPTIIADDLNEEQIKAFRLADNKVGELASWDFDKLYDEMKDINMDMLEFGFEELAMPDIEEPRDDEFDLDGTIQEEAFTKKGDIYYLGRHKLMCGDSTSEKDVDTLCGDTLADMIFTDSPYNVDYEGGVDDNGEKMKIQNDEQSDEDFKEFLNKAFKNMADHVKAGGSIYCCHSDTEGINFRTAFVNAGFKLAECLVWVKNSLVLGRQDYHWRHEPILYGWKEGAGHYFIDDRSQDTVIDDYMTINSKKMSKEELQEFVQKIIDKANDHTTIIYCNKPSVNDMHPTMKPISLVGRLIKNSSRRDEYVLDLFGGSGSTLIASEQLSRSSMLMEFDEKYADVIVKRYIQFKGNAEDCFIERNGVKTPLKDIQEFKLNLG